MNYLRLAPPPPPPPPPLSLLVEVWEMVLMGKIRRERKKLGQDEILTQAASYFTHTHTFLLKADLRVLQCISLMPSLCVPPGKKRSGEQSQTLWAYFPKVVRTNEIARWIIISPYNSKSLFISIRVSVPFLSRLVAKCFDRC